MMNNAIILQIISNFEFTLINESELSHHADEIKGQNF